MPDVNINQIVPGWFWLLTMILAHFLTSTIAHIKAKDFKISEWPGFLKQWLLLSAGIVAVNIAILTSQSLINGMQIISVLGVVQAGAYAMYIAYYLDNIFKHLNMMGANIQPGLLEMIRDLFAKTTGIGLAPTTPPVQETSEPWNNENEGGTPV